MKALCYTTSTAIQTPPASSETLSNSHTKSFPPFSQALNIAQYSRTCRQLLLRPPLPLAAAASRRHCLSTPLPPATAASRRRCLSTPLPLTAANIRLSSSLQQRNRELTALLQ